MSGLALRELTIGTSALGSRGDGDAALAKAIVTSPLGQIDTSNAYAGGRSEQLLGDALRSETYDEATATTIITKVDMDPESGRLDADRVLRSVEESIERLGVDRFPVLHLHDPYAVTVSEALRPKGPVAALVRLRDEGVAGAIGIAAGPPSLVEEYVRSDAFDAVLTHNRFTLVDRSAEAILDLAAERAMIVFNAAPFGGGILAGSKRHASAYGYRPVRKDVLAYIGRLLEVCERWQVSAAAVALRFSLREQRIHSTIVGVSSVDRLVELMQLAKTAVPDGVWQDIHQLGTPPEALTD